MSAIAVPTRYGQHLHSHINMLFPKAQEHSTAAELSVPQRSLPMIKNYFYSGIQFPPFFCLVDQFYLILITSQLQFFSYCHPAHRSFEKQLPSQAFLWKGQLPLDEVTQPLGVILWTRATMKLRTVNTWNK